MKEQPAIDRATRARLLRFQSNEVTEHHIYRRLADWADTPENGALLRRIAEDEKRHAETLREITGVALRPRRGTVWFYLAACRLFGYTFGIKLMERGEASADVEYNRIDIDSRELRQIAEEEARHEEQLIGMLDEDRLRYSGSMVLGLNDALVELTGALAGLTLALRNTRLIAMAGLITGIAAALSMAASEYLSVKAEGEQKSPVKAAVYTGVAYIVTVSLLISPYLLFENYYVCLAATVTAAVAIIALFTYYLSVAKDLSFRHRFAEMAGLSLGVAGFSFGMGYVIRLLLGVDA
jgi:vacuolar iron transporter family protein